MKHMVVLGATSEIAIATIKRFAQEAQSKLEQELSSHPVKVTPSLSLREAPSFSLEAKQSLSAQAAILAKSNAIGSYALAGRNREALHALVLELQDAYPLCHFTEHYFDTNMSLDKMRDLWLEVHYSSSATSDSIAQDCVSRASLAQAENQGTISEVVSEIEGEVKVTTEAQGIVSGSDVGDVERTELSDREVSLNLEGKQEGSQAVSLARILEGKQEGSQAVSLARSLEGEHVGLVGGTGIDVLFCAVGYLGDVHLAQYDVSLAAKVMQSNFNGLIPILSWCAEEMEERQQGSLLVISSVAGVRGRASNYCYGAAKAAMNAYLSGLRVRLQRHGVQVMTILPGYVATRMVAGRKLPPYITASVDTVAQDIVRGYKQRRDILYTMWLWRYIMAVTKLLPECIFKRLYMF